MFARVSTYGIVLAALLMTACSQNETDLKTASQEPVAISFSFTSTQDNQATTRGEAENAQLRNTGFGVFATVAGSEIPNLMYNQKVTYTYLADDNYLDENGQLTSEAKNGYWSYSPVKYWPVTVNNEGNTVPQNVTFCAYAPYAAAGGATGITGMSANTYTGSPYLDYTLSETLDETVDLLWTCYQPKALGTIKFNMYHALARVAVNVMVDNTNEYKTSDDQKVLISKITLSTSTAVKTGRLKLDNTESNDAVTNHYPIWDHTWEGQIIGARTVDILNIDNSSSYGIIAEDVRYIDDLPFSWQPKGVEKDNLEKGVNALCTGDYPQAYIYFVPNEAGLTLDCTVKYRLMEESYISDELSTTVTDIPVPSVEHVGDPLKPLRGNSTYQLILKINPKKP